MIEDLKDGVRSLRRDGLFTLVAILILALGIGSSAVVFTIVNSVLLEPLEYRDPARLVMVWEHSPNGEEKNNVSASNLFKWRDQSESFTELAAATINYPFNLTGSGDPEVVQAKLTSPNYFAVLGMPTMVGRTYEAPEEGYDLAVLSHAFWQRRFGADQGVIGKTIQINGSTVTITGVMPPNFRATGPTPDLWIPIELTPEGRGRFLQVVGRLRAGVTLEEAQSEMSGIAKRISDSDPEFNKNWGVNVLALHEQVTGEVRPALLLLMGAVGVLLLITCANVASLLLGRAAAHRKDFAVRLALGSTRGRLIRKSLIESLILSLAAGGLGVLLATWATSAFLRLVPSELALPRLDEISPDGRVLLFAFATTVITGILFGIAPALYRSAIQVSGALREEGRGTTGGQNRLRSALVVAEVALAVVLLIAAGLLVRSLQSMLEIDPGLRPDGVLTARMTMAGSEFADEAALRNFMNTLMPRLEALPGVDSAGAVMWLPFTGAKSATAFYREDRPRPKEGEEPGADIRPIAGDYLQAMGIPLLDGRAFDSRDDENAPDVFIINEAMAAEHFPGENPIGKRLGYWWGDIIFGEIVGVVGTVRESGLNEPGAPAIYRPFAQMPSSGMTLALRTAGEPLDLAAALTRTVREINKDQPLADVRPMIDVVAATVGRQRMILYVIGGFSSTALLLAALGLYAIISYSVTQRRREVGVRVALGAERRDILALVMRQGMGLAGIGLVIGIAAALLVTRLMVSMLFGIRPFDPLTLAGVALFIAATALFATWLPAHRATRVDPVVALRDE